MTDIEIINYNLEIIDMLSQEGPAPLDDYWDPIINVLSQDVGKTKELLLKCTPAQINTMGGYFEDVSYNLQSQEFIDFLRELQQNYPEIDLEMDIQWAVDAILD